MRAITSCTRFPLHTHYSSAMQPWSGARCKLGILLFLNKYELNWTHLGETDSWRNNKMWQFDNVISGSCRIFARPRPTAVSRIFSICIWFRAVNIRMNSIGRSHALQLHTILLLLHFIILLFWRCQNIPFVFHSIIGGWALNAKSKHWK